MADIQGHYGELGDPLAGGGTQYLTFILNGEHYGIEILKVQGVQGWQRVTQIPNMPAFLLGVINMRGDVVPIVDLRLRFALGSAEFTEQTVVVIVRVECLDHPRTIGLVVDAVSEVHTIHSADFRKTPEMGDSVGSEYLKGLGMVGDRMVILFDVERLVNGGVLAQVAQAPRDVAA
jgi:purine-binding chemotaxis protein CheW